MKPPAKKQLEVHVDLTLERRPASGDTLCHIGQPFHNDTVKQLDYTIGWVILNVLLMEIATWKLHEIATY